MLSFPQKGLSGTKVLNLQGSICPHCTAHCPQRHPSLGTVFLRDWESFRRNGFHWWLRSVLAILVPLLLRSTFVDRKCWPRVLLPRESRRQTGEFISLASWSKIQKQMGMHPVISQAYCNNECAAPNVGNVGFPVLLEHMAEKWSVFWIKKLDWIKVSIQRFQEFSMGNIGSAACTKETHLFIFN